MLPQFDEILRFNSHECELELFRLSEAATHRLMEKHPRRLLTSPRSTELPSHVYLEVLTRIRSGEPSEPVRKGA